MMKSLMTLAYRKSITDKLRALLFGSVAGACLAACTDGLSDDISNSDGGPKIARNVILFIGDGMGVSTVTAARIFDGQSQGLQGEEHSLPFEDFPHLALVKTYNTNQQVADSSGTATAMLTGQKTRAGVINVAPDVHRRDCEAALQHPLESLGEIAKKRGMSVGIATTTRVTHATPAVVYAHSPERDWESDKFLPEADKARGCHDIARQLVEFNLGGGLDVVLGGGRDEFLGSGGNRVSPQADLVAEWLDGAPDRQYVETREQLVNVDPSGQVLGLFAKSHMTYVVKRAANSPEPTLAEMTESAIDILASRDTGYFLMVEGGRIDHGHHEGKPGYALTEAQAFVRAIEVALDKIDLEDTLVLVTADHSHTFMMVGYPVRGNPILGLVVENDRTGEPQSGPILDAAGTPYTTISYANGPGAIRELPRPVPDTGLTALSQSLIPVVHTGIDGVVGKGDTHGGEDVALYAVGPGSDGVAGVIEQNRIFDIMMHALGWGQDEDPVEG
jgi:alkaline phosphatase